MGGKLACGRRRDEDGAMKLSFNGGASNVSRSVNGLLHENGLVTADVGAKRHSQTQSSRTRLAQCGREGRPESSCRLNQQRRAEAIGKLVADNRRDTTGV